RDFHVTGVQTCALPIFVPPEPPPLPETDATTKFAWLGVLGGPLLLIFAILFQQELTWWMTTLGIGGFLGGFATLVARMRDGSDRSEERRVGGDGTWRTA